MRQKITKLVALSILLMITAMTLSAQVTAPLPDAGYVIRIKESNGLIDNSGYVPGGEAIPWVIGWYSDASIFQRWYLTSNNDGYYKIQSYLDENAIVTVEGNSDVDNANIIQAEWVGSDYQAWEIQDLENGYHKVLSKGSGKAWHAENVNDPNHAIKRNIIQIGPFDTELQEFEFIPTADSVISGPYESGKSYLIASECTQMVMTEDPLGDNSGNLVQRRLVGDNNQKWQLDLVEEVEEDGVQRKYWKIINRESRKVLTLADTTTGGDGINVITAPWSDNTRMQLYQQWAIEPVVGIGDVNQVNVFGRMNEHRTIEIEGGPIWDEGSNLGTWWKFENTMEWERWQRFRFVMIDEDPLKTVDYISGVPGIQVYPNPANKYCRIKCQSENGIGSVDLYDITGKRIIHSEYGFTGGENDVNLDLNDVQKGIYMVTVHTPGGGAMTCKLVVK